MIEFTPSQPAPATPAAVEALMHSDAGANARVRQEHEEGQQAGDQVSVVAISHQIYHHTFTRPLRARSLRISLCTSP
jgi:hypothetical protein